MTSEFNTAVAAYWPTSRGYDPAKRSPMCELYETSLAMVIVWASDISDDESGRTTIQNALDELAVHLHHHRGVNVNDLSGMSWTDVRFGLYNTADRALVRGAGPNELAAATRAVCEYIGAHGIDALRRLVPKQTSPAEGELP